MSGLPALTLDLPISLPARTDEVIE